MTLKVKLALILAIFFWASAFVGIRAALQGYSPEGLALLRFVVASLCMLIIYLRLPTRTLMQKKDVIALLLIGAIGIGIYNITLNYGELVVTSSTTSFIISQSPIVTTFFALLFLKERLNLFCVIGFFISLFGIFVIAFSQRQTILIDAGLFYIVIATLISGLYSVLQKPYLKKYHAIEVTAFIIWGGTLFLMLYTPKLVHDLSQAPLSATLTIIYLGIFPATIGYLAWGFVLSEVPASRAVSFLYFMPFLATLIGWICLGEIPVLLSIVGGVIAIIGIFLVNQSYQLKIVTN